MGDEDRTEQQLPQRVKGTPEARVAPSASSPMSSQLRQRMRAAVNAERALATGRDQERPEPIADRNGDVFANIGVDRGCLKECRERAAELSGDL